MDDYDEQDRKRKEGIRKLKALLKQYDIDINIGACGCCDSPWVAAWHKGELLFDSEWARITMREAENWKFGKEDA